MLHMIAGGEEQWREGLFQRLMVHICTPMKFAEESLECLRIAVEGGMPVLLLSAGQAGASTTLSPERFLKHGQNVLVGWFTLMRFDRSTSSTGHLAFCFS